MGHTVNEKTSMGAIQSIMVVADGSMFGGAPIQEEVHPPPGAFNRFWYETH
jgi:hypothetical protein